jgi:putative transposase
MRVIRKTYDGRFKAKVALEAIKGEETISQIASKYNVHPSRIGLWKKQVLEKLPELFSERGNGRDKDREILESELYKQIGQLKVELEWLKKKYKLFT